MPEKPSPEQQVRVKRMELPTPSMEDPSKVTLQIEYQVGELPPRFLYINKKEWSKEKEVVMIKADIRKQLFPPTETITI